jgi:hypothetical protein
MNDGEDNPNWVNTRENIAYVKCGGITWPFNYENDSGVVVLTRDFRLGCARDKDLSDFLYEQSVSFTVHH